jgi:hypothetical protein
MTHVPFVSGNRNRSSSSHRKARKISAATFCEPLESRTLMSTINWANRNNASNNFASTWGANNAMAMAVVDAVLDQYERVIEDFNYSGGTTQYNINISMRDQPTNPWGGQTDPDDVTVNGSGAPSGANTFIGAGTDNTGDGVGDGVGYWLDPTPNDWSEFTTVVNAFVGNATAASPAFGLRDFYSIVAHEVGHAIGMTSADGSDWETFIGALSTDTGNPDSSGGGNLWAIWPAAVGRAVITDTDLGSASGLPVHTAVGGQTFMFNGQQYTSAVDVMNNTFGGNSGTGRRRLISNLQMGLIDAVANYDIVWPEQFGSMYTSLDTTTGQLTIRGGAGGSDDIIRVTWDSATSRYLVDVNIGNDVPGTGPTDAFESVWTDAQISSIVIEAGDGDDDIEVRTLSSNEPVTVNAGTGDDSVQVGIGDFDTDLDSNVTVNGDSGSDYLRVLDLTDGLGSDVYTITNTTFSKPGRTMTFSGIQWLDIDGSDNDDIYNIESFNGDSLSIDGQEGNDTFNIAEPTGDMDALSAESTLLGGLGNDRLNLFDQNDTLNDSYLFDEGAPLNLTKTGGGFGGMLYSGMNTMVLEANGANNVIEVEQFFPLNATINGNGGSDTFVVGDGDIDLTLGSDLLVLNGGAGTTDQLVLMDTADTGNDTHLFDRQGSLGAYTKVGDNAQIQFTSLDGVILNTSSATNLIQVDGLPSGADLQINGNFGGDTALIGGGDIDTNLQADVTFDGFSNGKVIFDDTADGQGSDFYTLDGGTLTKAVRTINFSNVTEVTLDCSPNDDVINLDGSFSYTMSVLGNNGDDDITFGDGSLAFMDDATIRGGTGSDSLRLDDTTTFAPTTWVIDQTGGSPFVDLFNGNIIIIYDEIEDLTADAGPFDDTITSIAVPAETSLRIDGNGGADDIDVQGHPTQNSVLFPRVTLDGGAGADDVSVNGDNSGGARATFENSQDLATLTIREGGRLRLAPGNHVIDVANSSTMATSNFELDLTDGNFVRRGGNHSFYESRVTVGYNAGAWNGLGINSSTAAGSALGDGLGMALASEVFAGAGGVIGGINLAADDLIIRYTLYGDATLNRQVDVADLGVLASNWQQSPRNWAHGDFDYNDTINVGDLGMLATNWQANVQPQPAEGITNGAAPSQPSLRGPARARLIDQLMHDAGLIA